MNELVTQALDMLRDRTSQEVELICSICKLDSEERVAIIMAYGFWKEER